MILLLSPGLQELFSPAVPILIRQKKRGTVGVFYMLRVTGGRKESYREKRDEKYRN